jgi:hypothetical protein
MLKWLKFAGNVILGLLIVYGAFRLYKRFNSRSNLHAKVITYFLRAEETEALYTGFSFVALLEFYDKNGRELIGLPKVYIDENKKINGICYRFYEVGIGYPRIGETLAADSIPEPEILSVNVVDSRVIGGGRAQYQCDLLDTSPTGRAQKLQAQMEADQQWQAQVKHAKEILVLLKAQLPDSQAFSMLTKNLPAAREIGLGASYLGNLKLTFATVGTFTATKRFLFVFEINQGFYVRKDITEATYGSQFSDLQIDAPLFGLSPAKATLTFEEPDLISVNRYIDLLVASSKFVYKNEEAQKTIDAYLREDVERQLKNIHGKAIEHSKRLTQLFIRKYGMEEGLQVELKFRVKTPREALSTTMNPDN